MTSSVRSVAPSTPLREAASLMRENKIRRLVVTDEDKVVGILCHRDVSNAYDVAAAAGKNAPVVEQMMKAPVITIGQDEPIEKAAKKMTRFHIGGLPVVNHGSLVGIITESDIFRALTSLLSGSDDAVRITFDVTRGDDVLGYLVQKTKEMDLRLLSFLNFTDGERRMSVAQVRGDRVAAFVDELWDSGHSVVNIIR